MVLQPALASIFPFLANDTDTLVPGTSSRGCPPSVTEVDKKVRPCSSSPDAPPGLAVGPWPPPQAATSRTTRSATTLGPDRFMPSGRWSAAGRLRGFARAAERGRERGGIRA